jgi:riboflavin kinase
LIRVYWNIGIYLGGPTRFLVVLSGDGSVEGLRPFLWFTLYELLVLGAASRAVRVSTTRLAGLLGCSQQSASRHLRLLEEMGLVSRRFGADGSLVRITVEGLEALSEVYFGMKGWIEGGGEEALVFEGTVFSGMSQGGYYVSQPFYRGQLREKLGFDPFLGTLNLRVGEGFLEQRRLLEGWPSIRIEGFRSDDRAFGGGRCYPLLVNGEVEGALVVADRTAYDLSVMEVIAPVNLRERFGLEDGDTVRLTLQMPERLSAEADG